MKPHSRSYSHIPVSLPQQLWKPAHLCISHFLASSALLWLCAISNNFDLVTYDLDLDILPFDLQNMQKFKSVRLSIWLWERDRHTCTHTMPKLLHPLLKQGVNIQISIEVWQVYQNFTFCTLNIDNDMKPTGILNIFSVEPRPISSIILHLVNI